MKIRVWGARGSIPSPLKPEVIEEKICQAIYGMPAVDTNNMEAVRAYVSSLPLLQRRTAGGNTSCVEIQAKGETFIIDAGSGLRELGLALMQGPCGRGNGRLHLFFSHPHWDHIQGFPFFAPAFIPGNKIYIYHLHNLELALTDQQRFLNFPVPLSYMQAGREYVSLNVGEPFEVGPMRINTIENAHPGKSYGFRFEDAHSTFVYANDAEYKQLDHASVQPYIEFFKGADALVFDAQYTIKEAWQKVDWGHSSALIGVDLARAAGVKRLLLFHHDPTYSDEQLLEIQTRAEAYQAEDETRPTCEILIAHEGLTLDLTPPGAVDIRLTGEGEAAVLTPTSVFDERGVGQLGEQLADLTEAGSHADSIVDLSQVETLTTASLRSLVALHRQQQGRRVVLASPSPSAQKVIELSDYSDLFAIYPSVEAAQAALRAQEALNLPGHVIKGRYQIISKMGDGRLGTILQALDMEVRQTVALKILPATFSEQTIERFLYHTQQIKILDHPNIVDVFDIDVDGAISFIVEEFITGQTLKDLLAGSKGPILSEMAIDIGIDIALALEYAHSWGALHGDLKPENIFLTEKGVKVSVFGLGHLEEGHNLLDTPLLFLTAAYLAPEQIRGEPIDARTDLYALGCILYELFTGRLPFEGEEGEIVQAHADPTQQPLPPRQLNPNISKVLEHLILKLLAKNPNDRFATAQQVRRICRGLVVGDAETARRRQHRLIGRQPEMEALRRGWQAAKAGQGQLILISGEPGIGKTSLAQYITAQSDAALQLTGLCRDLEGSPAFFPFSQILDALLAQSPETVFKQDVQQFLPDLMPLSPQLGRLVPKLIEPPALKPKQARLRLSASLARFMKQASDDGAGLLILDDLHWADEGTLEILRHLGPQLPHMKLLVIGICRDEGLEPAHPLRQTLDGLSRVPGYVHIPLERLDQVEVGQMLGGIWQQDVPQAIIEKIFRHTEGNPLHVEELARSLVDDGIITLQAGRWQFSNLDDIRLPENVREAIWRRTRRLSPDAQALLRRAAVLGRWFRFDDLLEMIDLSEWQVLEHLDMALERHLIEEASSDGLLRFSHIEIQIILYEDLDVVRRRILHYQAGQVLERRAQPQPARIANELAYHFGAGGDFNKAATYALEAGNQAKANYANELALFWYGRTLEYLDQLTPDDPALYQRTRQSVHAALAEVLTLLGRPDEAQTQLELAQRG